jgi:hypothetical protein
MATRTLPAPAGASTAPAVPRNSHRGDLGCGAAGALAGALVFLAAHGGLIDDTYITLGYVRNLASDLHWGMIPTEESNAATSPLNVLLLALATWVAAPFTGPVQPVAGLGVLTVVLSAVLAVAAARTARRLGVSAAWSLAVLAVVLANPFLNSALGLEVLPTAALLTCLTAAAVRGDRVTAGVLAGLLVLTRLDLGVLVAAVYLLTPALRARAWVTPLVASAVALPWYAFSWWHFGSAIPTTFVIKTLQRSFGGGETFSNGLWTLWAPRGTLPLALALVPAAVGLVTVLVLIATAARRRLPGDRWPLAGLGVGGLAYYGAYSLLGVPPYQWYYVPSTVALGVTGVFGLALLLNRVLPGAGPVSRLAGPLVTALAPVVLTWVTLDGRPLPWQHPVYFGSWATPQQYREIGAAVGDLVGNATVVAPAEIGTLAYGCDCSMVDAFSDPGRTLPRIEQRIEEAGPVGRALLEANFTRLDRDRDPRPAQYRLVWTRGRVPDGVPAWPTNSRAAGPATLYLRTLR